MSEIINIQARSVEGIGRGDWAAEVNAHHRAIDARLAALSATFADPVALLGRAMAEAVTLPGKRFRGVLMLMLGARLGGVNPALLDAACAVEMIHTASLVIDDLPAMDGALTRRGQPTTHVAHGEARAILAGIALISESFRILAALPAVDGGVRAALVEALAEAIGPAGLCKGQDLDLHNAKSMRLIDREQDLKTGQLFDAAFRIVARLQTCDEAKSDKLRGLSRMLGRAFQSYDDLLDLAPAGMGTGKTAGLDRGAGGPDKGLVAATGAEGAARHYRAIRRALDDELAALWFDAESVRDYVASVLPSHAPGLG